MSSEAEPAREVSPRRSDGKFKARISAKVREGLEAMAREGLPAHLAAERIGMRPDNFQQRLKTPHVKRLLNQLYKEEREGAGQQAYLRIKHQSETATTPRIKLDANKWIAGIDGLSPIQKVQGQHTHTHSFTGFDFEDEAVDITPDADIATDTTNEEDEGNQ